MAFRSKSIAILTLAGVLLAAGAARAQVAPQASSPVRGWVLGGSAGIASVADDAGAALGAALAWPLTPRWEVEIGGDWFARPGGEEAWAVAATTQVRLPVMTRAVPFLHAGVAAYSTVIDSRQREAPEFYRARVQQERQNLFRVRHTFTDPALVLGGGVDFQVGRAVHIRPTLDVMTVFHGRRRLVVPMATVQVSYHFESPRITPVRAR